MTVYWVFCGIIIGIMMKINWYPGHMTKAMRMMKEEAQAADCFICVLDSRAVKSSQNPEFLKIAGTKPILYVFNKADTVEHGDLNKWTEAFKKDGKPFVIANSTNTKYRAAIINEISKLAAKKLEKYIKLGVKKTCRIIVFGIPNSGKSTLINCLVGGKRAVTGNKPGVTRGKQWVNLGGGLELLDTPGTLPPNINNGQSSTHLALIGSINDDIFDKVELAQEAGADLQAIAQARGFLIKGGELDIRRAANAYVQDFRKQRLGKIMLEFP